MESHIVEYQEIMGAMGEFSVNYRLPDFMGTLGDTAIYNFENQGALNDGFRGRLVGLDPKGIMGCTFTFMYFHVCRHCFRYAILMVLKRAY